MPSRWKPYAEVAGIGLMLTLPFIFAGPGVPLLEMLPLIVVAVLVTLGPVAHSRIPPRPGPRWWTPAALRARRLRRHRERLRRLVHTERAAHRQLADVAPAFARRLDPQLSHRAERRD